MSESLEQAVKRYLNFLARVFFAPYPVGKSADAQKSDTVVSEFKPSWDALRQHAETRAIVETLTQNVSIEKLYDDFVSNRPGIKLDLESYITNHLVCELARKLWERKYVLHWDKAEELLQKDFIHFVQERRWTFVQMAPLFNFHMDISRVQLDEKSWIQQLETSQKQKVVQELSDPNIVISRSMLTAVQFGVFHEYSIPVISRAIAPPDQDLELDTTLALRVLKSIATVTGGYLSSWATGWYGPGNGTGRRSYEFGWPGPLYILDSNEINLLPPLWRELRYLLSINEVFKSRFLHTARTWLMRAAHEQDPRQRLLELFICIEALLLRSGEHWANHKKQTGASRLATLLCSTDGARCTELVTRCAFAHKQRNTVVHGMDMDIVGFDGASGTFDELVWEVDSWAREAILRILRLLQHTADLDFALKLLDKAQNDPASRSQLAKYVEASHQMPAQPS